MIEIKVNGVVVGKIDPDTITIGDQIDLEATKGMTAMCDWLIAKAGCDLKVLRAMPFRAISELAEGVKTALEAASSLPN